jgi:hypothetical protein
VRNAYVFAASAVFALAAQSTTAVAASSQEKAMASQLFDDAEKLTAQAKYADACPKYAESNRLDPQLGTLLHLGDCYDHQGKTASAWATFKDAIEIAQQRSDPREAKIREKVVDVEKRLPKLIITVPPTAPPDLEVDQDGNSVGRATWGSAAPVDPGTHTISAKAAGRQPWTQAIQIAAAGGTVQLAIPELAPVTTEPAPTPPPTPVTPPPEPLIGPNVPPAGADSGTSPGKTQRTLGFVALGAGVVGLAVGTVFVLQRGSKLSDRDDLCPSNDCTRAEANKISSLTDDARSAQTIATVGFIAGGALAAAGLVLVFTAPKGESGSVAVAPIATPGFQGLTVSGTL